MFQSQVKEQIKQISAQRRELDDMFSDLQRMLQGKIDKMPIGRVREEFAMRV